MRWSGLRFTVIRGGLLMYGVPLCRLASSIKKKRASYIPYISLATILSIVFFQSLLSSRITFQKLRKFQPNFPVFASLAKKNYKLKLALQSVYEQLSENKEDVTYFNIDKHAKNQKSLKKQSIHHKNQSSNHKEESVDANDQQNIQYSHKVKPIQQKMGQQFKIIPEEYLSLKENRKRPGRPKKIKQNDVQQIQNILQKSKLANVNHFYGHHLASYENPQAIKQSTIDGKANIMGLDKKQLPQIKLNSDDGLKQSTKQSLQSKDTLITHPSSQLQTKTAQFQKIKTDIVRSSKRQLFTILYNLQISNELLFKLLEFNILAKVQYKINNRQYLKIKQKLQKRLINIYFNYDNNHFQGSKRDLIRNKVKKKILGALSRSCRSVEDKMKVVGLQGKMWLKFKSNKQLYMKCVIECLDRLKVIDIGNLMQEWRVSSQDSLATELDH